MSSSEQASPRFHEVLQGEGGKSHEDNGYGLIHMTVFIVRISHMNEFYLQLDVGPRVWRRSVPLLALFVVLVATITPVTAFTYPNRTITKIGTSTSVSCLPSTVGLGGTTSCTAKVTNSGTSKSTPTGTVQFTSSYQGIFSSTSCNLSGTGSSASCSVTFTPYIAIGYYLITATYGGDSRHLGRSGSFLLAVVD